MNIHILSYEFFTYAKAIRGYTPKTIKRIKENLSFFLKQTGINDIEQITEQKTLQFFIDGRTIRNWTTSTYHTYHVSLLVFFRWCVSKGVLKTNPIEQIEKPRIEKSLPKKLDQKTALKILDVVYNYPYKAKDRALIRSRNHAIFSTFIYAGLRKKELLNLKFADVDLDNHTIFIRQGKGMKDRIIPISFSLANSLERYSRERLKHKNYASEFFISSNRNSCFTDFGLRHLFEFVRKAVGVKVSPHMLRHTFATLMVEGGCDIYSLSKLMGHSDIKTTTIYISATTEHLRNQVSLHPLNDV